MKIEQLIVQHLYNSKKVTLQDIGTFTLSPDVVMPADNDKESSMPENAVRFEYNKKAVQDDELISYIVAQTRKIKPLATSDLESYSLLAKQFLNKSILGSSLAKVKKGNLNEEISLNFVLNLKKK